MNAVTRLEPQITPRDDQNDALAAVLDALALGVRRPLVEAPCAWGKSVLIAMLALTLVRHGRRVLILAHRHELLEQNAGALLRLDSVADVGTCSASLRSDRLDAAIVVGGTASVFRRLRKCSTSITNGLPDRCVNRTTDSSNVRLGAAPFFRILVGMPDMIRTGRWLGGYLFVVPSSKTPTTLIIRIGPGSCVMCIAPAIK